MRFSICTTWTGASLDRSAPRALVVFLLGLGLTALGLVKPTMYDIGIVVVMLGGLGIFIRSIEVVALATAATEHSGSG